MVALGGMHSCLGGHAWLPTRGAYVVFLRGMHGFFWGGMHGFCQGACVVFSRGVCMVFSRGGACVGYDEIRSMSGRYASYWNAFLF